MCCLSAQPDRHSAVCVFAYMEGRLFRSHYTRIVPIAQQRDTKI